MDQKTRDHEIANEIGDLLLALDDAEDQLYQEYGTGGTEDMRKDVLDKARYAGRLRKLVGIDAWRSSIPCRLIDAELLAREAYLLVDDLRQYQAGLRRATQSMGEVFITPEYLMRLSGHLGRAGLLLAAAERRSERRIEARMVLQGQQQIRQQAKGVMDDRR